MARLDRTRWNDQTLTYRSGKALGCPGCGQSNWHVGRTTAECAHCATALPLSLDSGHWTDLRRAA